jgi:hypothetical protein
LTVPGGGNAVDLEVPDLAFDAVTPTTEALAVADCSGAAVDFGATTRAAKIATTTLSQTAAHAAAGSVDRSEASVAVALRHITPGLSRYAAERRYAQFVKRGKVKNKSSMA